jgi:uncharacterized protein YgbK (DUF1537 family)
MNDETTSGALLLAYYGDDFTGSADVMEVLQWAGLRTVLFLAPPTVAQLSSFKGLRACGIAGWSRTMSPAEMETELRDALQALSELDSRLVHYKTCSTFDSSRDIGNIGKAVELGREIFRSAIVPLVIGAPNLGRYQVFGNLFARSGLDTEPYRLDRHPTMSRHPITPMLEADVRVHLSEQTNLSLGLVDCLRLQDPLPLSIEKDASLLGSAGLLFDVLYPGHLPRIGQMVHQLSEERGAKFLVGSSGVEYALTAYWKESGLLDHLRSHSPGQPQFGPTEQIVAITGSCSPVNDRQIAWAEQHGFESYSLQPARLVTPEECQAEMESAVSLAVEKLKQGKSLILHSSRGPCDPRIAETISALRRSGLSETEIKLHSGRRLGPKLGQILASILERFPLKRVGVAGGDTSGYIARALGLTALEAIAPVAPGSPLCRAHASNNLDGVEFFFKGGQVGRDDVWGTMLQGTSATPNTYRQSFALNTDS